ncbi:helix-turn-helix transcriptional regulator [Devosia sp. A369]
MWMVDFSTIPERMYEAAFLPELWGPLLDDLGMATESGVGTVGICWPHYRAISTTFCIDPEYSEEQTGEVLDNWLRQVRSMPELNRGFFHLDPFRGDWSDLPDFDQRVKKHIQRGYGTQAGAILELFNGEIITLEFTRRFGQPGYNERTMAELNSIYPAFKQSVFFASRLQFERARSSVETLNDFGLPAALLGSNGQLIFVNNLFEGLDPYIAKTASGRMAIRGSDTLKKSFANALEHSGQRATSLAIQADATRGAAVIHLMPVTRDASSIFSMSGTIMAVAPVAAAAGVPSAEMTASLFGLTPAEARLSVALASGLSLRDSAANSQIGVGTARQYLNRIFSKTGVVQQSELVSLLKGFLSVRA